MYSSPIELCGQNNVFNRLATLSKTDKKGEERRGEEETSLAGMLAGSAAAALALSVGLPVGRTDGRRSFGRSVGPPRMERCELRKERLHPPGAAFVMHVAFRMHSRRVASSVLN